MTSDAATRGRGAPARGGYRWRGGGSQPPGGSEPTGGWDGPVCHSRGSAALTPRGPPAGLNRTQPRSIRALRVGTGLAALLAPAVTADWQPPQGRDRRDELAGQWETGSPSSPGPPRGP